MRRARSASWWEDRFPVIMTIRLAGGNFAEATLDAARRQ
jgi:hypothetical protein